MRRTCALLTAVLFAAFCSSAEAKLPAPKPPTPDALRAFGLAVEWPAAGTTRVAPGAIIALRVSAVGRAKARRRVPLISLLRVDAAGHKIRVIGRRRIPAGGTFRMPMPGGDSDARYQLRLDVGNRHYWSWLAPGAPGAPPTAACNLSNDRQAATLTVSPAAARTATTIHLALHNTGTACLARPVFPKWEQRLPDGTFRTIPVPSPTLSAIGGFVFPGLTYQRDETIWTGLAPGAYRLTWSIVSVNFTILP
jgi:hypothetical protein